MGKLPPTPTLRLQTPTPSPSPTPTPSPTATPTPTPTPSGDPIELGAWYAANGPGSPEEDVEIILDGVDFTVVRTRIIWTAPTGQWAWADSEINYHLAEGRKVVLEFWVQFNGPHASGGDCSTGTLTDYTTLVAGIADRYGNDLYAIQPENEVDRCNNPNDSADRLAIVYDAFHTAYPNVKVIAPGLAYDYFMASDAPVGYQPLGGPFHYSTLPNMLARLNAKNCAPCTDVFAFHKFSGFNFWPTVAIKASEIRSKLAVYGWNTLPLWLTEFGSPAGPYPRTEATQATELLSMAESARDEGNIPVAVVYSALNQSGQDLGVCRINSSGSVVPRLAVPTLGAMPR